MDHPPPLPKPIVTYDLCDCDEPDCKRMPLLSVRDADEVAKAARPSEAGGVSFLDTLDDDATTLSPGEPCDGCGRTDWVASMLMHYPKLGTLRLCVGCLGDRRREAARDTSRAP